MNTRLIHTIQIFALFGIMSMVASCSKDSVTDGKNNGISLNAVAEQIDTKTNLNGFTTEWHSGDKIKVFSVTSGSVYSSIFTYSGAGNETNGTFRCFSPESGFNLDNFVAAYYPGEQASSYNTSTGEITANVPSTQEYTPGGFANGASPMISRSIISKDGAKTIHFRNAFCVLKLEDLVLSGNDTVDTIRVKSSDMNRNIPMSGNFKFGVGADNAGDVTVTATSGHGYETMLDCSTIKSSVEGPFYIALVPVSANHNLVVSVNGRNVNGITTGAKGSTNSFFPNYLITMPSANVSPEGTLNGLFSVSPVKKVRFSRGNLTFRACTSHPGDLMHKVKGGGYGVGQFDFAERQYSIIGSDNVNYSASYTGWIDQFGYATSGKNPSQPGYGTGLEQSMETDPDYDWGEYNAISNGGNEPGLWRTLKKSEYQYLFETRTGCTIDGIAKSAAQMHGKGSIQVTNGTVDGIIVLPDTFIDPKDPAAFDPTKAVNYYTTLQWVKMQDNGAVFLPATGDFFHYGYATDLNYWTSSYSTAGDNSGPYQMKSSDPYSIITYPVTKATYRHSVRLVSDVN